MTARQFIETSSLIILVACLPACGGGGGVSSTPPPPLAGNPAPAPTPTPAPPPTPAAVLEPPEIGLVSNQPFKTFSLSHSLTSGPFSWVEDTPPSRAETVDFRYNAAEDVYEITLPGGQPGRLKTEGLNGTSGQVATGTFNRVTLGATTTTQPYTVTLPVPGSSFSPLTYTSFAMWEFAEGARKGIFAYGIPTGAAAVPVSGSASYTAQVIGWDKFDSYIDGIAKLQFDFAGGTLSGFMEPQSNDGWNAPIAFGRYNFTQTVFAVGSPEFSGRFAVPGQPNADSFFEGAFNGPNAAELMARWQAPTPDGQNSMFGIWVGKKD